jgi:hypothetical protein
MAILGVVTNAGLSASQDAALNEGFNLVPTRFGVSDVAGTLDPGRDQPTSGQFYIAPISSRVIISQNTIKFVLTVPPNQIPQGTFKIVREVYLYINDSSNNEILFAVGQPTDTIRYNFDQELTLDLEFSIINLNLQDNFVFEFTQATEISEHVADPNAHPEYIEAMRKAGIFIPAGAFPFERRGQTFEDNNGTGVEFDGSKATVTSGGVTFTSTFNGTELNGKTIIPDGNKTVDELRLEFNAENFPNTIEHDGTGNEVLGAGTLTLLGGAYVVQDKDIVYKDVDNVWKRAIADGSLAARASGIAFRDEKLVVTHGLVDINTGFGVSEPIFLSGDSPGQLTNFDTNINLGISLGDYIWFAGFSGDVSASASQEFDAVVTNATGLGQFLTTQLAIDSVPQDGRILMAKLDDLKETLDTQGKNLTIVSNSPLFGWRRFAGQVTSFRVDFDAVPTQGTFRIEWNSQETNDIPFNATALDIQNEFNLLEGSNGFTVVGDFATGFVFTSNDLNTYPLPTFVFAGTNEIQRFDFSNVPDDGTITFRHKGADTLNFPWDDSAADLKIALEALPTITNVDVTGEFAQQFFQIEFLGGFLADGVQEQPNIEVVMLDLDLGGVATDVNGSTILPIPATIVQKGKKPASNLFNNVTPVNISVVQLTIGEPVGPERAMEVDSELLRIEGMPKFENFEEGIVLDDPATKIKVEAYFPNTTRPILSEDKLPGVDYDFEALGYAKDVLSQLRITEHPTNKKRVKISGADQILASGITLTQDLNSLVMNFDGAEIDFSTDPISIFEADGVTPLGLDIVRPAIAPAQYRWFSINIVPQQAEADLSLKAQVLILPATQDGASPLLAEKPPFGDKPVGLVAVEGALGDKEKTEIVTVGDSFNSLKGKVLTLTGKLDDTPGNTESVAFWVSDESLDTFNVQQSTGVAGSDQDLFNSVTNKVFAGKIAVTGGPLTVDTLNLYLQKNGAPTGTFTVRLLGENLGEPDLGNVIASGLAAVDVATQVPTNFSTPVRVELDNEVSLPNGNYYVEINGDNLVITAGNFLGWNSEDNGSVVEIFNRDPSTSTWLQDLGNRTAHFELVDKIKGIPVLAQAADRNVEVTTILENDLQSQVASKFNAFINLDPLFNSTVNTNRITVENVNLGVVPDADGSDIGFFPTVLVQGTDTDSTGIEDISNDNIRQLGGGSGSGGGGGGPSFAQDLKFQLKDSSYEFLTGNVFSEKQDELIDNSDGAYSFPDGAWSLKTGQQFTTINLLDAAFYDAVNDYANAKDIGFIDLTVRYIPENIDDNATYEVSIDGGANFETITMEQIGTSDTFVKALFQFDDSGYTLANLSDYGLSNADSTATLNATTQQAISQEFTTDLNVNISREIQIYLNKLGSPTGFVGVQIVADDSGSPSQNPDDLIYQSDFRNLENLASGINNLDFTIPSLLLKPSTKYHLQIITDDTYKGSGFVASTNEIQVRTDSSSPTIPDMQVFNGSAYSTVGGIALTHRLRGRPLDLRLRITSSQDTLIEGFGIFYDLEDAVQEAPSIYPSETFLFSGDEDKTIFNISNFEVNPDTLLVLDQDTGQSWLFPSFSIYGNGFQVPEGTFDRAGDTVRVKATLIGGGVFANEENLNNIIAENHMGSNDPNKDRSSDGRGNLLRDGAGNLIEQAIDSRGMISFTLRN